MKLKRYIDIELLKYLILFYTLIELVAFGKSAYWKLRGVEKLHDVAWLKLLVFYTFLDWLVVLIFMVFISYIVKRMFEKEVHWKRIIVVHAFFAFLIGYFISLSATAVLFLTNNYSAEKITQYLTLDHFMRVVDTNFLIYFSLIGVVHVYYYLKKVNSIEHQKSQLQVQLTNTKMTALKAQLHPHFIFNTLNSISSLIEIDKEKSQNLIADFGDLFRNILEFKDENLIPLKQELELLDKYIDIITVRFSDHLVIHKTIEKGLEQTLIPSLLLQPLIENAIKHGYSPQKPQLIVNLSIYSESEFLYVKIENNGEKLSESLRNLLKNGVGLKNTFDRLNTLFSKNFEFSFRNNDEKSLVEALIKIPLISVKKNLPHSGLEVV